MRGPLALLVVAGMVEAGGPVSAGQPPTPLLPLGARPPHAMESRDEGRGRFPFASSARAFRLPSEESTMPLWTRVASRLPGLTAAESAKRERSRVTRHATAEDPLLALARRKLEARAQHGASDGRREGSRP
jgi:hypothetical protein